MQYVSTKDQGLALLVDALCNVGHAEVFSEVAQCYENGRHLKEQCSTERTVIVRSDRGGHRLGTGLHKLVSHLGNGRAIVGLMTDDFGIDLAVLFPSVVTGFELNETTDIQDYGLGIGAVVLASGANVFLSARMHHVRAEAEEIEEILVD